MADNNFKTPFDNDSGDERTQQSEQSAGEIKHLGTAAQGGNDEMMALIEKNTEYNDQLKKEQSKHELITDKLDFGILLAEYEDSENFFKKIQHTSTLYSKFRSLRRDGSCYYRSFMFRIFELLVELLGKPAAELTEEESSLVKSIQVKLQTCEDYLVNNGYDKIVVEDYCELIRDTLTRCAEKNMDPESLLSLFQNEEASNSIVMVLRFITSAYIQANSFLFEYYIPQEYTIEQFCRSQVEVIDSDADHVQIIAINNFFEVPQRVVYVDNSNSEQTHDLVLPDGYSSKIHLNFLYRPGHYDLIYPN